MSKKPPMQPRDFQAFRYFDDLTIAWRKALDDQASSWLDIWGKMLKGDYEPKEMISDSAQLWAKWYEGAMEIFTFPARYLQNSAESVPQLVFVIDEKAQVAAPKEICSPVKLDEKTTILKTPLRRVDDGADEIGAEHIDHVVTHSGNYLKIGLVDLDGKIAPGQYVSIVYIGQRGAPGRPLVLVNLFVTGAANHPAVGSSSA